MVKSPTEYECKLQEYRMIWFDKELKKLFGCTKKSGRAMHVYISREAEVGDWKKWINNRIKEATKIRTLGGCCVVGNGWSFHSFGLLSSLCFTLF